MSERREREADPEQAAMRARILSAVAAEAVPSRVEHRRRAIVIGSVFAAVTALAFIATGGVVPGDRPRALFLLVSGTALVAAVILTTMAQSPRVDGRRSMLGPPRSILTFAAAAAPLGLAAVAVGCAVAWPELARERVGEELHAACGVVTAFHGVFPLGALLLLRRGSDPVHPQLTGALLGTAAGAWATTLAYLRCPHVACDHCLVAHVLPIVALTAIGAILGRRFLRLR